MLSDSGPLKTANSSCDSLRNTENLQKSASQADDRSTRQTRGSSSVLETDLSTALASETPTDLKGSWKRNRTARKDGGAKRWGNANTGVLQLPNGDSKTYGPGSLVWAQRNNGLHWPAQVCGLEEAADKQRTNCEHTLVKFLGLNDSDEHGAISYVEPKSLSPYTPENEKLLKQTFSVPTDEEKYTASVKRANELYSEIYKEGLNSHVPVLESMEIQTSTKKRSAKRSGIAIKHGNEFEGAEVNAMRDGELTTYKKRKRGAKEIKFDKYFDDNENTAEPPTNTQIQHRGKKKRLSAVQNGNETTVKQDTLQCPAAPQQKTRGDDGYFFECVVCDMGGNLLCCDFCPRTYHLDCLDPPLKRAPHGKWHCPSCVDSISASKVAVLRGCDTKRSRLKKLGGSTYDTLSSCPNEQKSEKSHVSESSEFILQKRKKGSKKCFAKKGTSDGNGLEKGQQKEQSCSACGIAIEDNGLPVQSIRLCELCEKAGAQGKQESRAKEQVESSRPQKQDKEHGPIEGDDIMVHEQDEKLPMSRTEVDRIFGCRVVARAHSPNNVKDCFLVSERQSQSSFKVQSVSGTEVSPHALLESENVTERLSNSFNADDLVRSHGTAGKAMDVSDATCSSHLITGEINSQIRSGDLLDRNTSIKPEDQALGSENEGLVEVRVDAARTCLTEDEFEYLVKWVGKSHIHNEWIKETELKFLAKRKLDNYKFKHKSACINLVDEKWCKPQRIIAKRQDRTGCFEVLVKWCGLSYDECTWESIDEPVIQKHSELLQIYEYFEKAAVAVEEQDNSLPDKRPGEISTLTEQPVYIKGGTLFPHQMESLNWLRKCWWRKKNVILADEMGLGKTISASAFLCSLYREFNVNAPCLVLVPLSTMPNWMAEFSVWTPQLNVVEYHGGAKARSTIRQFEWHALSGHNVKKNQKSYKFNVLLTTYEMIIADASQLRSVPWEVLIVDEGHRLKNTGSKLVQLLNTFSFSQRVLLTGTPLQNNIGEMHNLLKFLQLDAFLSLADFEEKFNNLSTAEQVEELKKLVAPHMLRRLKKDAMQNIPPKMERVVPVELSSLQAEYYRALLTKNYQVLRQAGRANQHQSLVNIVVQLRKVCNHPYLIPGTEPETGSIEFLQEMRIKASAKLTLLHAMLRVLKEQGHRVLIFSQMTRLLDILEDYLSVEFGSHAYERVDGSISVADRQMAIARFNQDFSRFVFLLSTRACGLGINLATADTVIIYDSDFNPHADIQAMNRAHRIGQSKRLLVYRLVVRASVEERILQLAKRKLMLDHLFANKSGSQKEVEDILKWGTEELFQDCSAGEGALAASCAEDVEGMVEADGKLRKRSGGLGDVYEDTCHKVGRPKLLWDDAAIARLLDHSEIGTETVETEGESDMLGSFKAWDWNEQEAADDQEGNNNLVKDKDTDSNVEANNVISVQVTEEESDWDKILRTRWEKLQTEEEGALGRGKRTRKTVSYKENFSMAAAEVSTESGDEDEDPEPEYTPAGRALKSKLAKLRARQKERIASRGCKDSLGNFGHFYTSSTGLSACNGSQLALPTITTSMFLPVRLSEQDLRTLISDTGLTPNIFSMQNNDPATRTDVAVLDIQPSSAMKQSGLSNEVVRDLCERVDFTFNHMMKADLVNNSRDPSGLSSIEERCMKRDSYQDPEGEAYTDSRHSAERESPENPTTALDIRVEAFDFQRRHSKDIGAACNLLEQSKSPFELTEKHMPLKVTSEVSSLRSGLGFGHWEVHGPSQSTDCHEKSRESLGLDVANSLQGVKDIATSSQLTAPKSETEVGSGSTIIASYPQQIDAVKGRNFPFRSSSGDERATPCMPEATIWTEEELDALWSGVRRYGRGNWGVMLQDSKLCFSKLKTAKDLELRWSQEQIKFLGGSFDFRDLLPGREGSKPLFTPFCAGFPIPLFQRDVLGFGGPIDLSNPASLSQTKGLAFSDFDIELTGWRGSRTETVKLPTLPQFGVEVNNRLTHISSTSESTAFLRDPVPWIDVGQKLDLLTAGIPKVNFPSDNQVARSGRGLVFGSAKGTLQSNISNAAFQTNQSSVDLQSGGLLPRVSGSENEWRFSNLQLRFEKGLKHEVTDFSKSPVFSDKLAQSLHELPVVKPNLNLLSQHSLPENRSSGVQQNVSQFNVNVDKEQSKVKQVTQLPSVSVDEVMEKPVSSSLPHWLREAFKPPAVDMPTMPSTVGAVSHAISLIYRDCSPTLPAWVPPAPLPIAPHRKTKKRRKRKKGVGLGCRMMGDAHAGTREQLGNVLLPPLLTSGKKSQFPLLGVGNPGIFDNRLHDSQHSLQLLNGSLLPAFSHSLGPKYDWHGGESPFPKLDLQGQFPGIGNLPLTTCTISESMPVSSLTSSIMSYGKLVTPDLSLSSLLPRGKSRLNAQEQASVQQLWPSHGSGNNQSLHIVSQAHATDLKPLEMDPDVQGKQKSICLSADTDDSSSKTQSDTNVKHGGAVRGKKLDDEASSEETVSDSKSIAD